MASYTRLGSYLLSSELAADPFGKMLPWRCPSRAAPSTATTSLRTFSDELVEAGLGAARVPRSSAWPAMLAGSPRASAPTTTSRAAGRPTWSATTSPAAAWPRCLEKTREEQIPLGVDHALSVLQGLTQALMALARQGHPPRLPSARTASGSASRAPPTSSTRPTGRPSPPCCPRRRAWRPRWPPTATAGLGSGPPAGSLRPGRGALRAADPGEAARPARPSPAALARATLKAAQEDGPVPAEIAGLLRKRLLLSRPALRHHGRVQQGTGAGALRRRLQPHHLQHGLLHAHPLPGGERPGRPVHEGRPGRGLRALPGPRSARFAQRMLVAPDGSSRVKYFVYAARRWWRPCSASMGYSPLPASNQRHRRSLQAKIAALQREKAANDNKLLDISKQEEAQKALEEQLAKKAAEAKTAQERAKAKQDLEAAKAKTEDLARQKDEALKKKQELASATAAIRHAQRPAPAPGARPLPAPAAGARSRRPGPRPRRPGPGRPGAGPGPAAASAAPGRARRRPSVITRAPRRRAPGQQGLAARNLRDQRDQGLLKVFVDAQGQPVKVVIAAGRAGPTSATTTPRRRPRWIPPTPPPPATASPSPAG